jgi:hypothetical protein
MMGRHRRLKKTQWMIALMLPFLSCNEHLPSYTDPGNALVLTLEGRYILTRSGNYMRVDFIMTNNFDETLQAQPAIQGRGSITLKRDTTLHRSFTLSPSNIVQGYDPQTGLLTIDPGESVRFRFEWSFVDDRGVSLPQTVFVYHPDPTCPGRAIAYNETFILTGSLKVFDRIPTTSAGPMEFSLCYVTAYVPPNACPPINTDLPCSP